jgi:hypothetical protein
MNQFRQSTNRKVFTREEDWPLSKFLYFCPHRLSFLPASEGTKLAQFPVLCPLPESTKLFLPSPFPIISVSYHSFPLNQAHAIQPSPPLYINNGQP